jgi:hypothetical protein
MLYNWSSPRMEPTASNEKFQNIYRITQRDHGLHYSYLAFVNVFFNTNDYKVG